MKVHMDNRTKGTKEQSPKGFKPRRTIGRPAEQPEVRAVLKTSVPASLVKDLQLYAIQRGCSVADVVTTILRRAIPRLEVVAAPDKMDPRSVGRGEAQAEEPAVRHGEDAGSNPAPATVTFSQKKAA